MAGTASELLRRSFVISGHKTSLSLERIFWDLLKAEAQAGGQTMTALIAQIDTSRDCALSRAVRVHLLQRTMARAGARASAGTGVG